MFTARTRSLIVACAALGTLIAPAAANAASSFVSGSAPAVAGGRSCTQPTYNTIQQALNAGSAQINVCPGAYAEQLTITKTAKLLVAGTAGSAKVVLPPTPADNETKCDEAATKAGFQADQDAISICTAGTVTITGLKVEAKWPGSTCYDSLYGIRVAGGATLKATNVTVDGAGAFPINGCQGGVGIQAGTTRTTPAEAGKLKLKGVTVSNYQKNGITIAGTGSTASIATTTVIGAGETTQTAQNGIQVSEGAVASIKSSKVSGNECDNANCGEDAFSQTQATGLLFFGAGAGSSVTSSTLSGNDIGAYYFSESPTAPSSPELTLSKDAFSANRYEGVALDQGSALLKSDTINGPGNIGVDLFQYEGQTIPVHSSASSLKVEGMKEAAIKVESDKAAGDKLGSFAVSKSTFTGNGTVLDNESSTFEVVF